MEKFYKVYLTKSFDVAALISGAHQIREDEVIEISYGSAEGRKEIPPLYDGQGYYCCVITRESDTPGYELIIA